MGTVSSSPCLPSFSMSFNRMTCSSSNSTSSSSRSRSNSSRSSNTQHGEHSRYTNILQDDQTKNPSRLIPHCTAAVAGQQQLVFNSSCLVDWLPHCHDDRSERQLLGLLAQGESVCHWLAVLPAVKLLVTSAGELLLVISAGQLLLLCAARPACATIQPVRP